MVSSLRVSLTNSEAQEKVWHYSETVDVKQIEAEGATDLMVTVQ